MVVIEASILSADFARLGEQAREAKAAGVDAIQVDVMDGSFVPDITFGPGVVRALHPLVSLPLDVHLMIVEPERHLEAFANAGADRLIVHQETCHHLHRVLQRIRELKIEAGVAINPGTPLSVLEEVLDLADVIQVMTVNRGWAGWGGQPFLHSQLDTDSPPAAHARRARIGHAHRRGRRDRPEHGAAGGGCRGDGADSRIECLQR